MNNTESGKQDFNNEWSSNNYQEYWHQIDSPVLWFTLASGIFVLLHSFAINKFETSTIRFCTDLTALSTIATAILIFVCNEETSSGCSPFSYSLRYNIGIVFICTSVVQLADNYITYNRYRVLVDTIPRHMKIITLLWVIFPLYLSWAPFHAITPIFLDMNAAENHRIYKSVKAFMHPVISCIGNVFYVNLRDHLLGVIEISHSMNSSRKFNNSKQKEYCIVWSRYFIGSIWEGLIWSDGGGNSRPEYWWDQCGISEETILRSLLVWCDLRRLWTGRGFISAKAMTMGPAVDKILSGIRRNIKRGIKRSVAISKELTCVPVIKAADSFSDDNWFYANQLLSSTLIPPFANKQNPTEIHPFSYIQYLFKPVTTLFSLALLIQNSHTGLNSENIQQTPPRTQRKAPVCSPDLGVCSILEQEIAKLEHT
eukprot:gene202-365_t